MGVSQSAFTMDQLEEYQALTYFTKKEILHIHNRFAQLHPEAVKKDPNASLPFNRVMELPEIKVNPFKDRMCYVFSSTKDGHLTFEDFLDMMSVFSENASRQLKVKYAFQIYDFDGDDKIGKEDLKKVVDRLTGEQQLHGDDVEQLVQNILDDADLDHDNELSFAEFDHVISKSPDFINTFKIRL